ncbi:hypothetical protein Hypma_007341 [Hypsizygus marmoreus]|uniref:Uncharacterized protein n=1 Tax=Hypsizygus marmoreus TaxID=39966 RepID=A0A369JU25_HYPMA|nr:hypothetical protein Hypma_007341 [Hypsizygus marmoreus]
MTPEAVCSGHPSHHPSTSPRYTAAAAHPAKARLGLQQRLGPKLFRVRFTSTARIPKNTHISTSTFVKVFNHDFFETAEI